MYYDVVTVLCSKITKPLYVVSFILNGLAEMALIALQKLRCNNFRQGN